MTTEEAIRTIDTLTATLIDSGKDKRLRTLGEALYMAGYALRAQQEAEAGLSVKDGFEYVKNVRVSKHLALFLRPHYGCPRGPMGPSGNTSAIEILRAAKKYIIAGRDDRFVCVPEMDYEVCVKALEKMHGAEENGPLTLEELREMDGQPVYSDTYDRWFLVSVKKQIQLIQVRDEEFTCHGDNINLLDLCRHPPKGAG